MKLEMFYTVPTSLKILAKINLLILSKNIGDKLFEMRFGGLISQRKLFNGVHFTARGVVPFENRTKSLQPIFASVLMKHCHF